MLEPLEMKRMEETFKYANIDIGKERETNYHILFGSFVWKWWRLIVVWIFLGRFSEYFPLIFITLIFSQFSLNGQILNIYSPIVQIFSLIQFSWQIFSSHCIVFLSFSLFFSLLLQFYPLCTICRHSNHILTSHNSFYLHHTRHSRPNRHIFQMKQNT